MPSSMYQNNNRHRYQLGLSSSLSFIATKRREFFPKQENETWSFCLRHTRLVCTNSEEHQQLVTRHPFLPYCLHNVAKLLNCMYVLGGMLLQRKHYARAIPTHFSVAWSVVCSLSVCLNRSTDLDVIWTCNVQWHIARVPDPGRGDFDLGGPPAQEIYIIHS